MIPFLAVVVGAVAGLATVLWSRRLGRAQPKFWSRVLIAMQAIYLLFALVGRAGAGAMVEALVLAGFTAVAVAGARHSAWYLALGMLGHWLWDLRHLLAGEGWVLPFYPEACIGYDGLVGFFLLARAASWDRARRSPIVQEATP